MYTSCCEAKFKARFSHLQANTELKFSYSDPNNIKWMLHSNNLVKQHDETHFRVPWMTRNDPWHKKTKLPMIRELSESTMLWLS